MEMNHGCSRLQRIRRRLCVSDGPGLTKNLPRESVEVGVAIPVISSNTKSSAAPAFHGSGAPQMHGIIHLNPTLSARLNHTANHAQAVSELHTLSDTGTDRVCP